MNDVAHQRAIQEAVKPKFGRKQRLNSRVHPQYPANIEREYQRVSRAYMGLLNDAVKQNLPALQQALRLREEQYARHDGVHDWMQAVDGVFSSIREEFNSKAEAFGLSERLHKISEMARRFTTRQWKKVIHATLGIDLFEDYYNGEFYQEIIPVWIRNNVDLIKTIPNDALGEMRNIVYEAARAGKHNKVIMQEIQAEYNTSRRHAELLARDQLGKLHSDITQHQQMDAGVEGYIWKDSNDGRVRSSHEALNDTYHRWDDPPMVDERTGRRCHPGKDYECRCTAEAVFNRNTLNIPGMPPGKG